MRSKLNLTISAGARERLETTIRNDPQFDGVASIVWGTDIVSGKGEWMIGFYERPKVLPEFFVEVSGLELVVEPQWRPLLAGAELDLANGHYIVRGARDP